MNKKLDIIIFNLLCGLLLLPLLHFPLSPDLGVFLSSVRAMDSGGVPYINIFDIKPPIVFYFFQFLTKIFGSQEWSIRLFDFIVQLATVNFAYYITMKLANSKLRAYTTGIIYILTYLILNFNNTSQIESFSALVFMFAIYIHLINKKKYLYVLFGISVGLLTGMKYTMGMMLAVLLFDDLFANKYILKGLKLKELTSKYLLIGAGFIVSFSAGLIPYLDPQVFSGFREMSAYFNYYTSLPHIDSNSIKFSLKAMAEFFGDNNSIAVWSMFIIGLISYIRNRKTNSLGDNRFIFVSFLLFIGYLLTVVIERKFFLYHLSRLDIFISIIAAGGLSSIINIIKDNRPFDFTTKTILVCICAVLFLLSPIPRYTQMGKMVYYFYYDKTAYLERFQIDGNQSHIRQNHNKVADYINQRIKPNDLVINASTGSNVLTYLIKTNNMSKFCQSSFYIFPNAIDKHINDFANEIKIAKYLIIQKTDNHLFINGYNESTYSRINKMPKLKNAIETYMTKDTLINPFIIYKHKTNDSIR